jgi:nitrogen-specific signal transduction histidine kinase
MEASNRLGRLVHEIRNNLQVIRMEAELLKKASSEQKPQPILDAIQDIEKLLEEVKENFMLPR